MTRSQTAQLKEVIHDPIEFSNEIYESKLRLIRKAIESCSEPDDANGATMEFEI